MTEDSPKKRIRRSADETRSLILDVAGRIMVEEGYAAVTTRRIAKELGQTSALIHYYYPTVDDLFVALHAKLMDTQVEISRTAAQASDPLREFWRQHAYPPLAALGLEFLGVTNHRKNIAGKIVAEARASRDEQMRLMESCNVVRKPLPGLESPVGVTQVLVALARMVVNQETIGLKYGHDDIERFAEWLIDEVSGRHQ